MKASEEFKSLVMLACVLEPEEVPVDLENYVLTLSGTVDIGVIVTWRPHIKVDNAKSGKV